MRAKLTKRTIDALRRPEPGERLYVWDTELKGLGLLYHGTGNRKVFVLAYGPKAARRRMNLGVFGPVTVDKARELAIAALAKADVGDDPGEARRKKRAVPTFKVWVDEYLKAVALRKKRPDVDTWHLVGPRGGRGYQAKDSPAMERWANLQLSAITASDVQSLMDDIGRNHGRIQANRAYAAWRSCFQAAVRAGHIRENPCAFVRKFPENPPRQRTFSDEELEALLGAVERLPLRERAFFKLLVETGCRKSEALGARWEDVDTTGLLWTLRSPKAGRLQVMPLPPSTARMLDELKAEAQADLDAATRARREAATPEATKSADAALGRAVAACEWLFPSRRPGDTKVDHATEVKGLWGRVRSAADLPADLTLHDLRRTFGLKVARRAGILAASKLLRHSDARITSQVYTPLAMEDLRGVVDGLSEERGKVLPMKPAG
jgi:integrase